MRPIISLLKREFSAYFLSATGYVILFVFVIVTGLLFNGTLELLTTPGHRGTEYPMQSFLGETSFWLVFTFVPAVLTMRTLAEERGSGTLEVLMTAPIRDWQIVFCKFFGCFGFYLVLWLPTLVYLPILLNIDVATGEARFDSRPVLVSYFGVLLVGAMLLSLGLLVSSLVRSQLVAAQITLVLSLLFVVPAFLVPYFESGSLITRLIQYTAVPLHFQRDFTRGILDTRYLVLYLSVTLFCLFMTVRSLESRRWR